MPIAMHVSEVILLQRRRRMRRALLQSAVCAGVSLGIGALAAGQDVPNSSLYSGRTGSFSVAPPVAGLT